MGTIKRTGSVGLLLGAILISSSSLSVPAFAQAWTPAQIIKVQIQRAVQLAGHEARLQQVEHLARLESALQPAQKIAKDQEKFQQAYQLAVNQARLQHAKLKQWQKRFRFRTASSRRPQ